MGEAETLQKLSKIADECLELATRGKLSLRRTLDTFLPTLGAQLGARAGFVRTKNEEMAEELFRWGQVPAAAEGGGDGTTLLDEATLVVRPLDLGEQRVGTIGFLFAGDRTREAKVIEERVEAVAEELDGILGTIHTAAEKQALVLEISRALADRVFERGLDAAVRVLFAQLPLARFAVCWRDDVGPKDLIHYRVHGAGGLLFDSVSQRHAALDDCIAAEGSAVIAEHNHALRAALGLERSVEAVLIQGSHDQLGKILVGAQDGGLSTFAYDLVRVFAESISQRLVDHNRERRHLSQFFSAAVIDRLLRDPDYVNKYLTPREDRCAVIYADINGFTRISEQALETPERIGRFVDKWSGAVVERIWAHGGVFDKMVGDCVIGIFGPPFGDLRLEERALQALRAAEEIQRLTQAMESAEPDLARIREVEGVQGLGVAIGVNVCPLFVGLFGPNQDFTGFSAGMNNTARLQSLAGFRETLAMDSVTEALAGSNDPYARSLRFGEQAEAAVKNVRRPLRYHRVEFG